MTLPTVDAKTLDALQTDYFVWSAFVEGELKPLGIPLALSRRERDEIAALAENLEALIRRTMALCRADASLLDFWGFSPAMRRMIATGLRDERGDSDLLVRFDVFATPSGWKISEPNCDVPGGIHEAAGLNHLVGGDPGEFRVLPLLTDLACRESFRPNLGIVYASGFGEDLEQCQFLRQAWVDRGLSVALGSPGNLRFRDGKLHLFDLPLDALYRFFPAEWLEGSPALEEILAAVEARAVRMINPFSQLPAQSKTVMAFWHRHRGLFSAQERSLIDESVPYTEIFAQERLSEYLHDRQRWAIKRGFGRVGEQVLLGVLYDDEEWEEALAWPLSEPGQWIAQERFEVLPRRLGGEAIFPCYGAYTVGGRYAGLYTRGASESFIRWDAHTLGVKVLP